jgi:hypothetical protein
MKSEIDTELYTSQRLNGYYKFYPKVIDLLFSLQYEQGDMQDVNTDYGSFQGRADVDYSQLPYTFNSIFMLINKGYYLEATILVRQVFETLVQLRYFHKNSNIMTEHILGKYISFKDMMNDITTKDIYRHYRTLCSYSHGFIMKDLQRTFREDKDNPTRILGNFYNEQNCTIVTNFIFDLLIGVLLLYKEIFDCNTLDKSEEVSKLYSDILVWCLGGRESHKRENVDSIKFHDNMDGLIFVE